MYEFFMVRLQWIKGNYLFLYVCTSKQKIFWGIKSVDIIIHSEGLRTTYKMESNEYCIQSNSNWIKEENIHFVLTINRCRIETREQTIFIVNSFTIHSELLNYFCNEVCNLLCMYIMFNIQRHSYGVTPKMAFATPDIFV